MPRQVTFVADATRWVVWAIQHAEVDGLPVTRPRAFGLIEDMGFCQYSAICEDCAGATGYGLELGTTYTSKNGARAALTRHYRRAHVPNQKVGDSSPSELTGATR